MERKCTFCPKNMTGYTITECSWVAGGNCTLCLTAVCCNGRHRLWISPVFTFVQNGLNTTAIFSYLSICHNPFHAQYCSAQFIICVAGMAEYWNITFCRHPTKPIGGMPTIWLIRSGQETSTKLWWSWELRSARPKTLVATSARWKVTARHSKRCREEATSSKSRTSRMCPVSNKQAMNGTVRLLYF